MILGHAQSKEGEAALKLYAKMQQQGVVPNNHTYVVVLKACSCLAVVKMLNESDAIFMRTRCLEQARAIHISAAGSGTDVSVFVGSVLVDVYAKCGSVVEARGVFEKISVMWSCGMS